MIKQKQKSVSRRKKISQVNVPVKVRQSFLHSKKFKILLAGFLLVILIIWPLLNKPKQLKAEEAFFYPQECYGSWANAAAVAGPPLNDETGLPGDVAQPNGGGQELVCQNFIGELPSGVNIINTELEFVWSIGQRTIISGEDKPIESGFDILPTEVLPVSDDLSEANEVIEDIPNLENPSADNENKDTLDLETKTEPSPESINESIPAVLPPTSYFKNIFNNFFSQEAKAQEDSALLNNSVEVESPAIEHGSMGVNPSSENNNNELVLPSEDDLPTQTDEPLIEVNNLDNVSNQATSDLTESITENITQGTILFDVNYGLGASPWQSLGTIERENLSLRLPLQLTKEDISEFKASIISRMTIDGYNDIFLEAVRVIFTYEEIVKEVSQDEPDLNQDLIITEATDDNFWVIKIKKSDTNLSEIWYTDIKYYQAKILNDSLVNSEIDNHEAINNTEPELIANELDNKLITDTTKAEPIIISSDDQMSDRVEESFENKEKPVWNLIARDDLIHEYSPLGLDSHYVFWLSKESDEIRFYNIMNKNLDAMPYNPETGEDFVIYRDEGDIARKATLVFSDQQFIFEVASEEEGLLVESIKPEPLTVRKFTKDIVLDPKAIHTCRPEQFSFDLKNNREAELKLNLLKDDNYAYVLEVGGLPDGINVVFIENGDYVYQPLAGNDLVKLKLYRQVGAQKGNFTIPIVFTKKDVVDSSTICQFNVINL